MEARPIPPLLAPHLQAADVYAFGILMWEVLTGECAYKDIPGHLLGHQVVRKGHRPAFPSDTPVEGYPELAQKCWAATPETRCGGIQGVGIQGYTLIALTLRRPLIYRPSFDSIVSDLEAILSSTRASVPIEAATQPERAGNSGILSLPHPLLLQPELFRPSFERGSGGPKQNGNFSAVCIGTPADRMLGVLNQILCGHEAGHVPPPAQFHMQYTLNHCHHPMHPHFSPPPARLISTSSRTSGQS